MKRILLIFFSCYFSAISTYGQINQRFDNSNYKAIYFKEACELLKNNPRLILLDVRSPGEYADSSKYITSRIGRLKGAINISIDSIDAHAKQLELYRDKTILVYCSHSQRSRVVSKALADDGFTHVYSLNGGMTEINKTPESMFPCKAQYYTSNLPYKFIGPDDAAAFIKNKGSLIIDVRSVNAFNSADSVQYLNVGRVKGALNIPLATLDKALPGIARYKNSPVMVYELATTDAMQAALKLTGAGFKNVSVLFEGLNTFLTSYPSAGITRKSLIAGEPPYHIIGVGETIKLVNKTSDLIVADMRPRMEFKNWSRDNYSNMGHIKKAINFNTADQLFSYLKNKAKNTPILLYGAFNINMKMKGMAETNLSTICNKLVARGYTNVSLLYNGLYSVVWASGNTEAYKNAKTILTDHENLY